MVAGSAASRKRRLSAPSENSIAPHILRSACVFGANASGKSNLVRAFGFFANFVVSSAKDTQEGEEIDISPFKLDESWTEQPTLFEVVFIHRDALYQYGFAIDQRRVWGEWLFARPNARDTRTRILFQREYDPSESVYLWNMSKTHVKGEKETWKRSTRDNALFLSTAVQLKAETFKEPFEWIQKYLRVVDSPERLSPSFTAQQCREEGWKDEVLSLLQAADIKIKDIAVDLKEFDSADLPTNIPSKQIRELEKDLKGKKLFSIRTFHQGANATDVALEFREESDGSQVLFSIAGPWLDVLKNGYTLIIDELHNSLHPHILRFLVGLFHDQTVNTKNAQLIFTSHETSVINKGFMHQDQIWFMDRGEDESSRLVPLSDYKVRDVSAFQKAYLDGRYGAVPNVRAYAGAES